MKYSRKEIDLNYLKETVSFLISAVNPAKHLENKNASLYLCGIHNCCVTAKELLIQMV